MKLSKAAKNWNDYHKTHSKKYGAIRTFSKPNYTVKGKTCRQFIGFALESRFRFFS